MMTLPSHAGNVRWSETPPSYNTQEETAALFLFSVTLTRVWPKKIIILNERKDKSVGNEGKCFKGFWDVCFWTRWFIFETIIQKVKVKFRFLELKRWQWIHQLNMIISVLCVVKSSTLLLFYHVVTVSVKSVFNSSGTSRKLRSVPCVGEDQNLIQHVISH